MSGYPVHYHVEPREHFSRLQLLIRVVAFVALGMLGVSFAGVFFFAFLALPVYAASRLAATESPEGYLLEDRPRVLKLLHWIAAVSAWAGLVSEKLPGSRPEEVVTLEFDPAAGVHPDAVKAIWRVFFGLPSALVFMVLCCVGWFVWMWAALSILINERVGDGAFHYLVGLQRWCLRLLAYQASLVDQYPPFTLAESHPDLPQAKANMVG